MPTKTKSIKSFLTARTHADLAALYTAEMEVQVNVGQDGGERIEREFHGKPWHGWTDGIQTWKSFRIPWNASTLPEYKDADITFDLGVHAEGIGMTGWDWRNQLSRWIAYDFDAITGHSEKHQKKLTDEELTKIKDSIYEIPWAAIRKSTGGKGLHIYVFIEPVKTNTHTEHAALGRAILGKMSALAGIDLESKVDNCGQNMWIWHRKMAANNGLELIKPGIKLIEIPPHWRDHISVVTGHRRKNLPKFVEDSKESDSEKSFLELTGQSTRIPLDEEHKALMKWLEDHETQSWWDADHWMMVTHTFHLKEAHKALNLRGIFDTLAQGTEAGHDSNSYMFPLRHGGWTVRRYTMGVAESPSWDQDGRGWTRCYYNTDPTLDAAARAMGGIEDVNGSFQFNEAEIARDAGIQMGARIPEIAIGLRAMKTHLKPHKDGRLIMEIEGDQNMVASGQMNGWLFKKGKWVKIFPVQATHPIETEVTLNDDLVRHIVTTSGEDFGWVIRGEADQWRVEPLVHVQKALEASGMSGKEVKILIGSSILKCWNLVNFPFQAEYPGNRIWNRNAAQFRFIPSQNEELEYPTWLKILNHIGKGLDDALRGNPWGKMNGITTGADYLKIWIASLFKEPTQPLPYLFLYGEQNTGKSIFHEALSLLMTKGYARADNALINQQGFNQELANAVLCVVEEINLRKDKNAANRIKDFVTAINMPIHEKGRTPYHIPNTSHWVQCSNDPQYCPVLPGDTRITMVYVEPLPPIDEDGNQVLIPKKQMLQMLEKEAPDFLAELMRLDIPPSNDRLNVPVIATAEKVETQRSNQTPLQTFIEEKCHHIPGEMIKLGELYDRFVEWADPNDATYYTKHKFGRELPPQFPKGRSRIDGSHYVGNISFTPFKEGDTVKSVLKATAPEPKNNFVFLEPVLDNKTGAK